MRLKVELHPDVAWVIRHRCNAHERSSFYERLEQVRSDPIELSEPTFDPQLGRYMLRFFRFEGHLAIFQLDIGNDRIRVTECHRQGKGSGRR